MKKYLLVLSLLLASTSESPSQESFIHVDELPVWSDGDRCEAPFCKAQRAHKQGHEALAIRISTDALNDDKLPPFERQALLWLRGDAYEARGQFDEAITDETAILTGDTDPDLPSVAYLTRAQAYFYKYEDTKAAADIGQVIARAPDAPAAYLWRGWLYAVAGNEPAALADFDAAQKRSKDTALNPMITRASMYFIEEKFSQAAVEFSRAQRLNPDPELALWMHLSQLNAGIDDREEFRKNATDLNLDEWPGPLIKLFLGEITEEEANQSLNEKKFQSHESRDWLCEEMFGVAEWRRFVKNDPASARPVYEKIVASCPREISIMGSQNALKHING